MSSDTGHKPRYHDDRRPRIGKSKSGAVMFWHPCKICGLIDAPYGVNVSLRNDNYGDWYCAEHLPEEHRPPHFRHATAKQPG